ncbi:MAG: hypothetical protein ACNYPD_01840 [Candidatus Halichondribacter symbioticus]
MITIISTIKTHITTTRLATRGALIALFAGLFILAACGGGGGGGGGGDNVVPGGVDACINPFDAGCGDTGAVARAEAINACRLLIEASQPCADTIPLAVRACLTDPYVGSCDEAAYTAAIRTTTATVLIGALRTGRTNDCRGRSLAGVSLCGGAIVHTCDPVSTATNATRNQLILDNLCNNAPNYIAQRQNFIADCTDRDLVNDIACGEITTCTKTPFNAGCDVDVYDKYRAAECHTSGSANARCGSENIIATYCTNNIFTVTAGCSTNDNFDDERIAYCVGNNGRSARCQNTAIFTTTGLTDCFIDPYGTVCDTALGGSLNDARNNHKTYCTGLGVRAEDNMLCDAVISNVCTGDSADIFDALCFADNYQTLRENTCRTSDVNSRDARCPATVAQICATNPFTLTTTGYLCTDNLNSRVALVARCVRQSQTGVGTGCNVTVDGRVTLNDCIADPYTGGCRDAVFNDLKAARYAHCTSDVPTEDLVCTGVESIICISGSQGEPLANPYHALCRNSDTNYGEAERQFCSRLGSRAPAQCGQGFRNACGGNPFIAGCLVNNTYAVDRAVIISACLDEMDAGAVDTPNCDRPLGGGATVGACATNPFDTANGCNTNAGFERTRTTRSALCAASATPFDSLCNNVVDIATARATHCTTPESSFNDRCLNEAYPDTLALRESFCTQPVNLFTKVCTDAGVAGGNSARTALAELCSTNAEAAGCNQFVDGISGLTIAQCSANPFNTNNGCDDNTSFTALRTTRTTLCETVGEQFNPLCNDFDDIDTARTTYCTVGAGSFDADCELGHADGAAAARKEFARLCRSTLTPRPDCATTIVVGNVSVADCVANPYRRECYGTEDNRNLDFEAEVTARDALCTGGDVYSHLCLLNDIEIVAGVKVARSDGCTTPALAAFNDDNCSEDAYVGTEAARRGYCSTDAQRLDAVTICVKYQASICDDDITANPFAAICGDNAAKQAIFCRIPSNPALGCSNVATVVCPSDPFNRNAGFAGMTDCLTDFAYTNQRAERCAAGTQGTGDCDTRQIVSRVCTAVGSRANPFAEFCATADSVIGDLDASKTTFANACAENANAREHCNTSDVKTALCSGSGDFLRPFSAVCNGVSTTDAARISFCGTGDKTGDLRCNDSIIAAVCRTDPFSSGCATAEADDVAELRDLRAAHCESLTDVGGLCSAEAVTAVCEGYMGVSGAVDANPLANLCTAGYTTERLNACLGLNSQNTACDGIEAVADTCRENPFDANNPGCALLTAADDIIEDYCKGPNTWLRICDELAGEEPEEGDVNEIAVARRDACVAGSSGTTAQCEGISESVTMACEATPFGYGCRGLIDKDVLAGYQEDYCETPATAWDVECDTLDAAGGNTVNDMRGSVCEDATQADDANAPGYFNPRCNTRESFRVSCSSNPFDTDDTPGCAFHGDFEELAANYCKASGTAWEESCDMLALATEGINDIVTARLDACLVADDVDTDCPSLLIVHCDDADNSANAFAMVCGNTGNSNDRAAQLRKACAEGGTNANTLCSNNDNERAKVYCRTIDPYAGIGCEELATDAMVMTFRTTYCSTRTELPECSTTDSVVCMANPFDGRCVDEMNDTTYADARKVRADECRDNTKSGDACLDRVVACNNRPFGATSTHFPTDGTATACSADTAFAGARAALITKCIVVNAVRDDIDCQNAVIDGVNCLAVPYGNDDVCMSAAELGNIDNVMKAKASFCRTTTGSNSFNPNCDATNDDVIEARVDSCLASDTIHGDCPALITGFCTNTDEGEPFDNRCTGKMGNDFARVTLCANGETDGDKDGKCATILGDSFTDWAKEVWVDEGEDILDAGSAVFDDDDPANFIKGVLDANDKLYLGAVFNTLDAVTIRLNREHNGEALLGDAEDGFAVARGLFTGSLNRLYVGILHTTDLGAPITNNRGRASWKALFQVLQRDGSFVNLYNTAEFVLRVDFDAKTLSSGVIALTGGTPATISITKGSFNKTTGLITGTVLFADTAPGSTKTTTGILRGVIGREGAVGVFASGTPVSGDFGDFVGGFVASSADKLPICVSLIEDPFGENCLRSNLTVLNAQFKACSTGFFESNSPVDPKDCNHVQLSGVICSDAVGVASRADPFAQICSDDAITIFNSGGEGFSAELTTLDAVTNPRSGDFDDDGMVDFDDVREKVRLYCADITNSPDPVCVKRQGQIDALSGRCVVANESTLFASLCASYREFGDARALLCRDRANERTTTYNTYNCDTKDITAYLCAGRGAAANPFDAGICNKVDNSYLDARQGFAARCARNLANDPTATADLDGADCSGVNQACLIDPFSNCDMDENYDDVRDDRKTFCRDGNVFNYECRSAILEVCGPRATPTDAVLFSDKLCASDAYDTRRTAIVRDCAAVAVSNPEDANCQFEIVEAVTRLVDVIDDMTGITTQVPEIVTPAKKVGDCITDPYDVECAAVAFDNRRTAVLGGCESVFTGAGCLTAQAELCGAGIYADDPFDAFCDKTDTTDPTLTIAPEILADGRNKHCQIGTNATDVPGCATFLARPTTAALLNEQTNKLDKSPNRGLAANQFLRGTADGLNTGGFIEKDGAFADVRTLNLGTATYKGVDLGGESADGVAFFAGREHKTQGDITTDVDYYAGIHSGTDLGKPLPRQYGSTESQGLELEWNGSIGWLVYDSLNADGYAFDGLMDFTLTINLTDRTIYALTARTAALYTAYGFLLEGKYDENGVINGTAQYGIRGGDGLSSLLYQGFLIGLIGDQGAVGAFHLTPVGGGKGGASGGFVVSSSTLVESDSAVPDKGSFNHWLVNREDAIAVLETTEEVNENAPNAHFIVGGGAATALGKYPKGNQQDRLEFGIGTDNGLVFGFDVVSGVEKFYSGLLVDTDLGAPIQQTSDSAIWDGRIAIAKQDTQGSATASYLTTEVDFKLTITFNSNGGTFTSPTGVNDRITFSRSIYDARTADQFVLSGSFNKQGLLRGTTIYYAIDGGTTNQLGGILTGLIGINGAAGVFVSNPSGSAAVGHYTGGFIASEAFGRGGAEYWQANARLPNDAGELTVNNAGSAKVADSTTSDYTFIGGGSDTLSLGNVGSVRKSTTLTQDLTFGTNLTLPNGDVFSLNNAEISGGISFAQATVGTTTQFYAGLLSNTSVGAPLDTQLSVNWRGVLGIIAGDTPLLYTTDFTLAVNFSTMSVFSNAILPLTASNLIHNIIIEGRFNTDGIIYGTATYEAGGKSTAGVLTGLIGVDSVAAVFGGDATSTTAAFVGGLVAVPSGTSLLTPNSQFAWVEGIDETVFKNTRFNADVVTPPADAIILDTTVLGGLDNVDGTQDGFAVFTTTETMDMIDTTTRHVGVLAGANLGGPVVNTGGIGFWHARMAGLIIGGGTPTAFDTDFTLRVVFNSTTNTITADEGDLPTFSLDDTNYWFTFTGIGWNINTGFFTGDITLNADVGEATKGGVLHGIIGRDGAIGTFRVSQDGVGGRDFIGGFVAVPESIAVRRGQPAYWAQYARNADNTAGLEVRGIRAAKADDGEYTVIEGGLETLELGLAVAKNTDADLNYNLTFKDTVVLPDGSTISLDPSLDGGISFSATETIGGKYYVGLLSGTDVGRLLSATPSANWVGRLGIIVGSTGIANELFAEDFELAIDFDARTLKSFDPDVTRNNDNLGVADRIVFETRGTISSGLIIDGEFNDRGIIYGTTNYKIKNNDETRAEILGTLTGLIGQKGAAAVFYSSGAPVGASVYAGGFIAVPDNGPLTRVRFNTPAGYNVWADRIDTTTQQDATSVAATETEDASNTAAFTTEIPDTPSADNQISLTLAPFGGDAGDGLFGYAADNARHIGLLPTTNLGGVPIYAGTAEWSGVMQWILGDGSSSDVFTQNFTLRVDFDEQTLTFVDTFSFTSNLITYILTFNLDKWSTESGLITGAINIAHNPNTSAGNVRGIIGRDGVVAAFRSTSAAHSSFSGGFVATETKKSETSFTEYFSSTAGGSVLQAAADGGTAKFARTFSSTTSNGLLLADGSVAASSVFRLGEAVVGSGNNPNGFAVVALSTRFAAGILTTTDLGAPLSLTLAGTGTWTGKLHVQHTTINTLFEISLTVDFIAGTIKTAADGVTGIHGSNAMTIEGYFGLNPRALAANLPLGLLIGDAIYSESYLVTADRTDTTLSLIGQIGEDGVVAVFSGTVGGDAVAGGFTARSVGVTADYREYNKISGVIANIDSIQLVFNNFAKANAAGNITGATTNHQFGLGGEDNSPTTNPNGFTLGVGTITGQSENRIVTGIWGNVDLGLLVPRTGASATWAGTVQTLKIGPRFDRTVGVTPVKSPFTIQVDFVNSQISTVSDIDAVTGAVTLGTIILTDGDTLLFSGTRFNAASGVISPGGCPASCPIVYTTGGTSYGLSLIGLIGQKGALGIFRGYLVNTNTGDLFRDTEAREHAAGIVGGFEVTPTARRINPDIDIVEPVIPPKQINYATYIKYYQTDYVVTRHGPGVNAEPNASSVSQFLQSLDNGTNLATHPFSVVNSDSFSPFTVYLNGEDASTSNGFILFATSGTSLDADTTYRHYAGLLAGANVGRFSDDLKDTTATWHGRFYSSALVSGLSAATRAPVRFPITLSVDFGAGSIRTSGDFVLSPGHSINIEGSFGYLKGDITQGLISGFITYTAPNDVVAERITRAPLYGIIGDAGALAVFAGGQYGDDGLGADSPLVGGFEVSPKPVPTASYALFYNYFSRLLDTDGRKVFDSVVVDGRAADHSTLLPGTATGLLLTLPNPKHIAKGDDDMACLATYGDDCNNFTTHTFRLGGNRRSNSGFAIVQRVKPDVPTGYGYAGILSGTNLGAILPVSFGGGVTKAIWHGSVYTTAESASVAHKTLQATASLLFHHPLSLTVDLSAGTLRTVDLLGNLGTVALTPTSSIRIDAQFGLNPTTAKVPYGILLGSVEYNGQPYTLAGLIGVEGAIGLFRANFQDNGNQFHGGFEVSPPPPPAYGRGNYAVFDDFYHRSKSNTDTLHLAGSITADTAQFVRGTRTGLVKHTLTDDLTAGSFAPLTVFLGGDVNSGNAFIIENYNGTYVAGLLGTTDLGFAPHEGLASATWLGTFYVSSNVASTGTDAPAPFVIKSGVVVDFGAGTITSGKLVEGTLTSSQETYTLANTQFISFGIYGKFGEQHELPLGILGGFVKYGHHETDAALIVTADLPLIGVIGRAGALGIFRDPSDNNLVGGFEAGIGVSYDVFTSTASAPTFSTGVLISPSRYGGSASIDRRGLFEVNVAGTGLKAKEIVYVQTGTTPPGQWPKSETGALSGFETGTKYGLGDNTASINGFILADHEVTTTPTIGNTTGQTAMTLRIVGVGLLPTANLGPAILDVKGSAFWAGKAYVIDTIDDTTKVFELKFRLDFARGEFNTIGGTAGTIGVTRKIGTDGMPVTGGQAGQTLKISGLFGLGAPSQLSGYLHAGQVIYNNGADPALNTTSLFGLIGRGGAIGVFYGGTNNPDDNPGYAGGFWARPSTDATEVNYASYLSFYGGTNAGKNVVNSVTGNTTPGTFVRFLNGIISGTSTDSPTFRLGGDDADATNKDGLRFYVADNVKTVGILGETNLGAVLPNTTPSATWYGRLFAKTDATAFNPDNERQIRLDVDFSEGTIDTPNPVKFTIGTQTHSLSVHGRFGFNDFARRSSVPAATGLLSGFVEYTHYQTAAVRFDLIGIIGTEGVLGIFKGNVAGVGLVGGFEATAPDTVADAPNHATYIEQFDGYINGSVKDNFASQISEADGNALIRTPTDRNFNGTGNSNVVFEPFRLGGTTTASDTNYGDGFAFVKYIASGDKSVGLLRGTNLGTAVVDITPTAIWSGRLVVHYDKELADTKNSQLDLQVNFAEGTIETLAPISIVAYKADATLANATRKQTLEIKGRFGSHADADGLRTGILGGTVIYTVGHYTLPNPITRLNAGLAARAFHHTLITARFPLLGLIGTDGAIGVFQGTVSKAALDPSPLTTQIAVAGFDVHIVGGFEVSPRAALTTDTASFKRWAREATQCESIDSRASTIDLGTRCDPAEHTAIVFTHPNRIFEPSDDLQGNAGARQGFVLGSTTTIGIDVSDALSLPTNRNIEILTLGGHNLGVDAAGADNTIAKTSGATVNTAGDRFVLSSAMGTAEDGIVFVEVNGFNSSYAGLLSGTDLGAPLTQSSASAFQTSWYGTFAIVANGDTEFTHDFVLDIDFANSRISWTQATAGGYALQGSYDEFGVITGVIKGKQAIPSGGSSIYFTGNLTGLIGAQGAVGAFTINVGTWQRVGGFVAAPVAKITATSYAHFSEHHKASTGQRQLHVALTTGGDAALVVGTPTGLDNGPLTFGAGEFGSTAYKLGGVANSDNGFAVLRGTLGATTIYRAGILSDTDLGPVVSAAVNGLWTGNAYFIHTAGTASRTTPISTEPLIFDVNFAAGTINTKSNTLSNIEGFAGVATDEYFRVRGTFGNGLPPGILGGMATHRFVVGGDNEDTVMELSGLIGAEGAIGVFARTDGNIFRIAGGFTAQPFALTPAGMAAATAPGAVDVNVLQDYATLPTRGIAMTGGFVKLGNTLTSANVTSHLPTTFTLDEGPFMIRNDIEDIGGVGYFAVTDDNEILSYNYVGIFADTDLGTPVRSTDATITWTGIFSDHGTIASPDNNNFVKFHVDFRQGLFQFRNAGDTAGGGTLTRGDYTYTLNGRFGNAFADANNNIITTGQLGGQVLRSDSKTAVISGLIGVKGAVGAFVNSENVSRFAGGFWAVPNLGPAVDTNPELVSFSDWSDIFGRATPPPTKSTTVRHPTTMQETNTKSEFLTGKETVTVAPRSGTIPIEVLGFGLNENEDAIITNYIGSHLGARFALNFGSDSATHDGKPLGVDATGGVAGFTITLDTGRGDDHRGRYRFAGLLPGTNLGAPISADTLVGAWRGRFVGVRTVGGSPVLTIEDFTLNVTFNPGGGGTLAMDRIEDSFTSTDHYYTMAADATYNASGVISGTLNFHDEDAPSNPIPGILTGLIGQDGAVGAFISGTAPTIGDGDKKDIGNISEHHHSKPRFFGGFVASQPLPDAPTDTTMANYENFEYHYANFGRGDRKLFADFAASGETVRTAFLVGTTTGLNLPTSDLPRQKNLTVVKLRGDESSSNGFAFVSGNITPNAANERFRVGLLSDTNVGAVFVTAPELLTWTGSIHMLTEAGVKKTAKSTFTLNFGDGTLTTPDLAIGTDSDTIRIAGTFKFGTTINSRLSAGILGGSAVFTRSAVETELPLIGLIGANGAIGVFHADTLGVGGFEAGPPPPAAPGEAAYWLENAVQLMEPDNPANTSTIALTIPTVALVTGATNPYGFITAGATELNLTDATQTSALKLGDITGNDNNTSGFAIGQIGIETDIRRHVGILDGTNVGAPLPLSASITGKWSGFLAIQRELFSEKPIILNVGFDGTTGTIKTQTGGFEYHTIGGSADPNIAIDGKFGTNGVIYGTTTGINTNTFSAGAITGTLTGLIGVNGAVAVFAGNAGNDGYGYAGGFVARPRPADLEPLLVNYTDWTAVTKLTTIVENILPPVNSFVSATGDILDTAAIPGASTSVNLSTATNGGNALGGDTTDGFAYRGANGANGAIFLVGITQTTNLGAPLDATTAGGTWKGSFVSVEIENLRAIPTTTPFALDVVFGSSTPGKSGSVSNMGDIGNTGYSFTGEFDANGVIIGTTNHIGVDSAPNNGTGTMRGLIGEQGAVGVFISDVGAATAYGGGFVACPIVSDQCKQ